MPGRWTLNDLVAATDEPEERIRRYAAAGLLHRHANGEFDPDSPQRLRLIGYARSQGFDDEQILQASSRHGDLLAIVPEPPEPAAAAGNLREAADGIGISTTLLDELTEIIDWDLEHATESDLATLRVIAHTLDNGFPQEALLRLIRVFADATERLADTAIHTFHDGLDDQFRTQNLNGTALNAASTRFAAPARRLLEHTPPYLYRRAYRRAAGEDLLRRLREERTPPTGVPGEERSTVLFVDLAGFTPLTASMGDLAAAEVLHTFSVTVRDNASRYAGQIVKQIGDAFMLLFARPASAVEFGLAMNAFVDTEPQFPALHIGAHHGGLLYRDGDYLGSTVNLAARVTSAGVPGQFLVTAELRDATGPLRDAQFIVLPPRRLKGISDPIRLIEVRDQSAGHPQRETDPVCGMRMHPQDVAYRTHYRGATYAFCSAICKTAFDEGPERFLITQTP